MCGCGVHDVHIHSCNKQKFNEKSEHFALGYYQHLPVSNFSFQFWRCRRHCVYLYVQIYTPISPVAVIEHYQHFFSPLYFLATKYVDIIIMSKQTKILSYIFPYLKAFHT